MKKTLKNTILILVFLVLSASTAYLAYLHFFALNDDDFSGEWMAELNLTKQATVTAYNWLREIEAVSVSLEDVRICMQDMVVQVDLGLEQTSRRTGTFRCSVLPESYDACRQAAYEGFATAFQTLLAERLQMAGYEGSMDGEAIEALVTETFGMSTASYLMTCAPALLPSLEELQAQYDGSGTYEAAEGILTRQYETDGQATVRQERYLLQDASLILLEDMDSVQPGFLVDSYPMLYTREHMLPEE